MNSRFLKNTKLQKILCFYLQIVEFFYTILHLNFQNSLSKICYIHKNSFLVYGIGKVKLKSGKSITVTGTAFVDLPTDSSAYQVFNGMVVYAKHSKQIVDFKKSM